MDMQSERLEELVANVRAGSRYRQVSEDLIRDIGARELARRASFKEAVKAVKNKLHQVGGAYLAEKQDYSAWLSDLTRLTGGEDRERFLAYLKTIMLHHASTRERLPILEQFYPTLLAELPPVRSVLDIACGLNPLALPWMSFAGSVEYYACDIYRDMVDFLNQFMELLHVRGQVEVRDVIQACPTREVDLAFVLKTIPCLEQMDKTAGARLLHTLNARHIVVSFPVYSLGGKARGMQTHYATSFRALLDPAWQVKRFEFATELAFVIRKEA